MKQQFEANLTGSDATINGIVTQINYKGFDNVYEFESIDNNLHLIIAKDNEGKWFRLAGTEPYLPVWIDELVSQILTT